MKRTPPHPMLAALCATLLGSLLGSLLVVLLGFVGTIESVGQLMGGAAAIFLYGFMLALPFVFLYGMPLYALLRRVGAANIGTGLIVGSLPGITWIVWTHGSWLEPSLWNGSLIALFYCILRGQDAQRPNLVADA